MGAFYGNIVLKGPNQEQVLQALCGRRAIVSPKIGDFVMVFDSVCDEQDIDGMQVLTSRLSSALLCFALAVIVHDDDVFGYFLYNDGGLIDWYNSNPNYFDFGAVKKSVNPAGGNIDKLCGAFEANSRQAVENILRKERGKGGYVIETDRHKDLVGTLSLPAISVGNSVSEF